ncbi:MAG: FtsX-like permease family protein, partial [Chloroflexi bacterium]|nr:FtsX-like permease family protein [Chloroflexota bacterium]
PSWDDATPYASVIVSGVFERNNPDEEFWYLDDTIFKSSTSGSFRAIPFFVTEKAFMEVIGTAFPDMDSAYGWLLQVDESKLNARNSSLARFNIGVMEDRLSTNLFSFRQITELEDALIDYDRRLFFSKLPMFIVLVLIAVVILYYVVTISSLVVEQQRGEIALLKSRGASSAQILTVFVLEGASISILAIAVAPILAATVISILGLTPAFSDLSGNARLTVSISSGAYMMSALGGIFSFAALLIPAIQASRIGVTKHRQESARPDSQPFFQRYYLDVMLLIMSVVLFRQLTDQGSVVATGIFGEVAVNQVLLAVPALILVAFAMVLLRLFPLAIRFLSGDSPALLHLVVGGAVAALAPTIAVRSVFNGDSATWVAQVAALIILAGAYWATNRATQTLPKVGGMAIQAGMVAAVVLLEPALPMSQVFAPILIAIVPAQILFILFKAYAQIAPVGFSMGLWQMARNPTHYARLSLLLMLMSGLGIFAASFGGTLERSFEERARYATGTDIRMEGVLLNSRGQSRPLVESYENLPGVDQVGAVFRGVGTDLSKLFGDSYTMFAMDSEVIDDIGWFRDDFSEKPMSELIAKLKHPSLPEGIQLPIDATTIKVMVKANRPQAGVGVATRLRDANNRYFTYIMGTLNSTAWVEMESSLSRSARSGGRRQFLEPTHPMTLVSISVHKLDGRGRLRAGTLAIGEVSVRTSGSREYQVIESFNDISKWSVLRAASESISDSVQASDITPDDNSNAAMFVWTEGSSLISRGIFHGPPVTPVPVLASKTFLKEAEHSLGDEFQVSVQGHRLFIRLIGTIDFFPTLDTFNNKFLISDLASVTTYANLEATASELRPNEIWLTTNLNGSTRAELLDTLVNNPPFSSRAIQDTVQSLADSQVDPLVQAGWRALLFIAFSTVLVLSGLGFLVHAYVSFRSREMEFALMRTIGFSMRQLIALVWLEQALIIFAGMALGTWMGGRLGAIIMPFLSNDDQGSQVLPPFVIEVSWGTLLITYAIMALVFALIITGMIWFVRRISLQRILRLGEM